MSHIKRRETTVLASFFEQSFKVLQNATQVVLLKTKKGSETNEEEKRQAVFE